MSEQVSFRETLGDVHRLLRGEVSPAASAVRLDAPTHRLAAYQQFVFAHIRTALEKNYVTLMAVLPSATWEALVRGYFTAHPADDYELNATASRFPDYLATLAEGGELGITEAHVEIALLEWQEFAVFVSHEKIPPAPDRPVLNPTLAVMTVRYPVGSFIRGWRSWEAGALDSPPTVPDTEAPEIVLVYRDPRLLGHRLVVADDALLFAFKVVHEALSPSEAATAAEISEADVHAVVERAKGLGFVVGP